MDCSVSVDSLQYRLDDDGEWCWTVK